MNEDLIGVVLKLINSNMLHFWLGTDGLKNMLSVVKKLAKFRYWIAPRWRDTECLKCENISNHSTIVCNGDAVLDLSGERSVKGKNY